MRDTTMRDHLMIVTMLPDYVLGTLDDATLRQVARHLERCDACHAEFVQTMTALGALAVVPPPAPSVRGAVLERAATLGPAGPVHPGQFARIGARFGPLAPAVPLARERAYRRSPWPVRPAARWALAMASAAVLLGAGLLGWNQQQSFAIPPAERIEALVNDPTAAYPLGDSDLPVPAAGVIFAEPMGREVYLVANGLPVLPSDRRYQVWLFTANDELVSLGMVSAGPDGAVNQLLKTPAPFATYVGVALTVEPKAGSDMPTSAMVLGGSLPSLSAAGTAVPGLAMAAFGHARQLATR